MALNEIARHFYEKEFDRLSEDKDILKENYLDMKSQIDDLYVELGERARRISELESELAVKEDLLKIANGVQDDMKALKSLGIVLNEETLKEFVNIKKSGKVLEEPLPFSDEEYKEIRIEKLEDRHMQDCITINQLQITIDTLVDRYAKFREMKGL